MNGEVTPAPMPTVNRGEERKGMARVGTVSVLAGLPLVILLCLAAGLVAGAIFPHAAGLSL